MTGFEYALAALMIHNGIICEGERIVRTVRERYDGEKRNPYNEIECGSNYARSMASFALLPIYSGFRYDMTKKYIGFFPVRGEIGRYFFSVQNTWGTVRLEENMQQLRIEGDALELREYGTHAASRVRGVVVDGKKIAFTVQEDGIAFAPVRIQKSLKILLI